MGLSSRRRNVIIGIAFAVTLLLTGFANPLELASAATSSKLTVNAVSMDGNTTLGMWAEIRSGNTLIKAGFTPLTIAGTTGAKYSVTVNDYRGYSFDHWKSGDTARTATLTLLADTTLTSFFRTAQPALNVYAMTANNEPLHMWTVIKSSGVVQKAGLTPFTFSGMPGRHTS